MLLKAIGFYGNGIDTDVYFKDNGEYVGIRIYRGMDTFTQTE